MLNWEFLTRQNECSKYSKFNLAMYCSVFIVYFHTLCTRPFCKFLLDWVESILFCH